MNRWRTLAVPLSMLLLAASCTRDAPAVSTILCVTGPTGRHTLHLLKTDGSSQRAVPERKVGYIDLAPDGRIVSFGSTE